MGVEARQRDPRILLDFAFEVEPHVVLPAGHLPAGLAEAEASGRRLISPAWLLRGCPPGAFR